MRKFKYIIIALISVALTSCETVFQYPEGEGIDPTLVNVNLKLSLQPESILEFEEYDGAQTLSRASGVEEYQVRTIVEIYDATNLKTPLIRKSYNQPPYSIIDEYDVQDNIKLNAKKYKMLVWADVIDNADCLDFYYQSADLRNVLPLGTYVGASEFKHCFSKTMEFDLTPYRNEWNATYLVEATLERPLARFEIHSTDLDKFYANQVQVRTKDLEASRADGDDTKVETKVDLTKYTVKLHYDGYMPYGYNVETDLPNRAETGVEYTTNLHQLSATEARLSFDHVFVNHSESSVNVSMTVYDEDGDLTKQTNSIRIPLKRNKKTIITGNFLTRAYAPGVSIDPSFEGDINIWVD